ncbi:hypothetical protein OIE66_28650 [Nonomuraea sp. NBC_01738]|uniref:hypothetical protein n=1 Tax=Nonomuraea sp. NBC_01738 TaxID=2976003 RepID=UPI002E124ED1|nr:hypothetical protein OIE66_28650 [Nonomuraea sp. NBC_01738]
MRHALSRHDDIDPAARPGFYAGWSGLAAAALRAGHLLDAPLSRKRPSTCSGTSRRATSST